MKQIIDQFLQFLQQGIAAIFRFVQLIWTWSSEQITKISQVPWDNWPLWKQALLIVIIVAVGYALFIAARQLWVAGLRVLTAFASFLGALVVTLPAILLAGCVALAGLWVLNNLSLSSLPSLTVFERSATEPSNVNTTPSGSTTGQGHPEPTGSKQ